MRPIRLIRLFLFACALAAPAYGAEEPTTTGECTKAQLADATVACATVVETSAKGVNTTLCRCTAPIAKKGTPQAPSNSGVRHEYH